MHWFTFEWWRYLLEKPSDYYRGTNRWTVFWCRLKGHEDIVYYNFSDSEPDCYCKNCGDDLG